jgi:2-methylcitrate dehydratase PrpD
MEQGLSRALAGRTRTAIREGLPVAVAESTTVFVLNSLGTVIAGSKRPVVDHLVDTAKRLGAISIYRVPGRPESLDISWSALAIGAAGHVDDFDDTHFVTYIHAGPTLVATGLTLTQHFDVSGARLLEAIALGYEIQFRAGLTISPEQYVVGWHSTGVFGVIGAATTASVLLGLNQEAIAAAIDLSAQFILGHQEGLGTMNKSFHAGRAAANGLRVALAVRAGLHPSPGAGGLESMLGAMAIGYSPRLEQAMDELNDPGWRLLDNRTKPFPCGIVAHPGVEAALSMAGQLDGTLDSVQRIVLRCAPLATTLTGIAEPTTELNTRLSLPHAVAAALVRARAGLSEFTRESISDPEIARLRCRVELVAEPQRSEFSARLTVERNGHPVVDREVMSVTGSPERPMSDDAVASKFAALVEPVLPGRSEALRACVWSLPTSDSISRLHTLTLTRAEGGVHS